MTGPLGSPARRGASTSTVMTARMRWEGKGCRRLWGRVTHVTQRASVERSTCVTQITSRSATLADVNPSSPRHDFDQRVALITGAARGLGRAAAERLLARGASVAVNVRDPKHAEALARELGDGAFAVPG